MKKYISPESTELSLYMENDVMILAVSDNTPQKDNENNMFNQKKGNWNSDIWSGMNEEEE